MSRKVPPFLISMSWVGQLAKEELVVHTSYCLILLTEVTMCALRVRKPWPCGNKKTTPEEQKQQTWCYSFQSNVYRLWYFDFFALISSPLNLSQALLLSRSHLLFKLTYSYQEKRLMWTQKSVFKKWLRIIKMMVWQLLVRRLHFVMW
jgi:hypothetical protein